jgi:translocation and assembly module TamB
MSTNASADRPPPALPPRRRRRWGLAALAAMLILLVLIAAGTYWIVATPGGAQLVLARVAGMLGKGAKFEGVEGQLGGSLRIKSIEIDRPDLFVRVDDLEIVSSPRELLGRLAIQRLTARSVEVRTATSKAAARVPVIFKPPYPVRVDDARVGTLRLGAIGDKARERDLVLEDIALKGEGDKRQWTLHEAGVKTEHGTVRLAGTLGTTSPYAVDLTGDFAGSLQERAIRAKAKVGGTLETMEAALQVETAGAHATAKVVLQPFADTPLKSIGVEARDVDLAQFTSTLPTTRLAVVATLVPDGKSLVGPVRVTNAEPGPWDKRQFPFLSAAARVVATRERADLADLDMSLLGGGRARGRATLHKGGVEADLNVADLDLAALHGGLQKTQAAGRVTIAGDRGGQRFEAALKDPRFEIDGRATLANDRLEIPSARIRTGGGAIVAQGGMGMTGRREFRFEGRGEHFDPSAFVKTAKGDLNFTFVASGTLADGVAGAAKIAIAPSTYAGQAASGRVDIAGDRNRIASADVDVALGEARVNAKGSFGRAGDAMEIVFRVPNLSVVAAPLGLQLAGRAEGNARLTGTFQSPAGRVSIAAANLALPANVYLRELTLRAEAGAEPGSPVDASAQASGIAFGKARPPGALAESATATLKGTRAAHRLDFDAKLTRDSSLAAAFQGGLDPRAPTLTWNGRVESFAMTGRSALALASPAPLSLSAARVELGDAVLRGEWGETHLAVTRWTPRTLELKGTTPGLQVQNLARNLRLGEMPRSSLVVAGDWDIRAAETFEGMVNLQRVSGDIRAGDPPLALGLSDLTLRVDAVRGRATATVNVAGARIGRIQGDGTGLIVRGESGWEFAETAPIDARVAADVPDLQAFAAWIGPEARLGGHLVANIVVSGTGADPSVNGQARAENLVVREPQTGFEISEGQVALNLTGHSLAIERLVAKTPWRPTQRALARMGAIDIPADGGSITAEGSIDLAARQGAIRIKADKVPVTQLPTRFAALSGEARLEAGASGLTAKGAFKADAGWISALAEPLPTVSDDVVVVRASQPATQDERKGREPMRIDVQLGLDNKVYFQGRGLDARLDGELHVVGEVGSTLRATGRIRAVEGTYEGYGQKLEIERGVLTFNGALDNPQLDVLALRKGLPVEAGVEILGTTTRPRVRLVSRPDVPEPEKLSWLVLGRGASDASPGDMSVMLAAAQALLGQNNPGSDLGRTLGLDEVKIGRADASSVLGVLPQSTVAGRTGNPAAAEVVSVGKRLNRNLQLTYEQGLADAEGALKITWRISQRFQLLVRAGFLPGVDAVYRWTFK